MYYLRLKMDKNMKVYFRTNLDKYNGSMFPELSSHEVPRKGDFIELKDIYIRHFQSQKLPTRLEVVSVTWKEDYVECELWYNKTDVELYKMSGGVLF